MRRLTPDSVSLGRFAALFTARFLGNASEVPEAIREAIAAEEHGQREKEQLVDSRSVVFASAASADHRPRIAAAEAFDIAAAALPRPPNFCFMNLSLDYAGMMDSPEVVWFNLCRMNGVSPSSVRPQQLHMMGGTVRHQRPGGGYIQILLGCVPDLGGESFTFDTIPEEEELADSKNLPAALCMVFMDNKLTLQHEHVLSERLQLLSRRLGDVPVVGGVFPATQLPGTSTRLSTLEDNKDAEVGAGESCEDEMGDSVFFLNERIYSGSIAGVVLRSAMLKAHHVGVVPSISLAKVKLTGARRITDGKLVISSLDNKRAADVIRDLYCSSELEGKPSKVFLAFQHEDRYIPVSFTGYPHSGELLLSVPEGVQAVAGATVELVVDDVELDTEASAGLLIGLQNKLSIVHVEKDINVAREGRKNIVASSAAALHFSHGGMNAIAKPEVNLTLGRSSVMYAPSVLQRCLGSVCPTAGVFCPGQILSLGRTTGIFARSGSYCVLEGLK
ncbi:hypothetical protein ERJ75_001194400 [Trypanosoma vivax]|nr:hypothetical protein TRVL_01855 [Trypanosoma vivax]KAH8609541.1 hypothetical protein ERJ75_001194400 [Trypanosoma vivax]